MNDSTYLNADASCSSSHETHLPIRQSAIAPLGNNRVTNQGTPNHNTAESSVRPRSRALCRFRGTKKGCPPCTTSRSRDADLCLGCRAGADCPFRHVDSTTSNESSEIASSHITAQETSKLQEFQQNGIPESSSPSLADRTKRQNRKPVSKPIPTSQTLDPRDFEISQVVRRYSPERQESENGTILFFNIAPSDPDFPFELPSLQCKLTIPLSYPINDRPTVRITNKEMARGYQINIERGFDSLAAQPTRKTLLSLLRELDKNLEAFLSSERAQTIKLVANTPAPEMKSNRAENPVPDAESRNPVKNVPSIPVPLAPSYSTQEKLNAKEKRSSDVRQLEARMSRVPAFSKSGNGTTYNIPLQISKPGRLPISLQPVKEMTLTVPQLYNLEPCTIKLNGIHSDESHNVEAAFEARARTENGLSLMVHINYLTQNMHTMALSSQKSEVPGLEVVVPEGDRLEPLRVMPEQAPEDSAHLSGRIIDTDRPHLQTIPRPPEWNQPRNTSDTEEDSTDSYDDFDSTDSENQDDAEAEQGGATIPSLSGTTMTAERGVQMSFPDISYTGIELLEISSLALVLKCDRCKTSIDVHDIRPNPSSSTLTRTEPCGKCINTISISYRSLPLHANSNRAGFLDLGFCTVLDLLPTKFTPTCSSCSSRCANPITAVRGDTGRTNTCRTCHAHQTLSLPDVRFLRVSTAPTSGAPMLRRKPNENLGIVTGEPLPRHGACRHYSKSHRWFRFSCCNKVFACDKCHDENMLPPTAVLSSPEPGSAAQTSSSNQSAQAGANIKSHPNEHANRMICGFCSREQNYRPEDCGYCGRALTGKSKTGGFWEGGKGTRDQTRMRRKERRKFKRLGGAAKKD